MGTTQTKSIDYDKIRSEHHGPRQTSPEITPATCDRTDHEHGIYYGHIRCLCINRQYQTSAHGKNKTGYFQGEGPGIGVKTGTPEISYFLQSVDLEVTTIPTIPNSDLAPSIGPSHTESFEHVMIIYVQTIAVNMF